MFTNFDVILLLLVIILINISKLKFLFKKYNVLIKLKKYYTSVISFLIYIILKIKLDIVFIIFTLNRYLNNPTFIYIKIVKRIFKYFKSIIDLKFVYYGDIKAFIKFVNVDYIRYINI